MTVMTDYRSVYIKSVLPPKPDKTAPKTFTMADLKADAQATRERLRKAWGNSLNVKPEPLSVSSVTRNTPDQNAALVADIFDALTRCGPLTTTEMLAAFKTYHTRRKLKRMLTDMHRAGHIATRRTKDRQEWLLAGK